MNIDTQIKCPIEIEVIRTEGTTKEVVGDMYASIDRSIQSLSIQVFISNQELAKTNMDKIKIIYDEFYNNVKEEGKTAGWLIF